MTEILRFVDQLPNCSDKLNKLNDIRACLVSMTPHQVRDAVPNISFNVIFDCLQTEDRGVLDVCCAVLDTLLSACEAVSLVHDFHAFLLTGLTHPHERVIRMCLKLVLTACKSSPQQIATYTNLVCQLVQIVGAKELSVAKLSMDILTILGSNAEGLQCLFSGAPFLKIKEIIGKSDEIRYRVFQILVDVASTSELGLQACVTCGLLPQLLQELQTDDILVQLNAIELLTSLACTQHGLHYLDEKGTISTLDRMLTAADTDPLSSFLMPGLLKFFGHVAHQQPEEIGGRLQPFINTMFSQVDSTDSSVKLVAIETLGHVAGQPEGKMALDKQGNAMRAACHVLGNTLRNSQSDVRARLIDATASLLHLRVADQSEELLSITEGWCDIISQDMIAVTIKQCQQPFQQLRSAGFSLLRVLANQLWGQRRIASHPAAPEYLLDRTTETTKEAKDAKFTVIRTLVESPTAEGVFGRVYYLRLREHFNEGPYFMRAEANVAFEEDG